MGEDTVHYQHHEKVEFIIWTVNKGGYQTRWEERKGREDEDGMTKLELSGRKKEFRHWASGR